MANCEHLIPHILRWETGRPKHDDETNEEYFNRTRKYGYTNDPRDRGGATQSGLTLTAYQAYCKKHNISTPTIYNLKNVPYATWFAIFKENYWDRYKADQINNQSVADILVDYVWGSGSYAITKIQRPLGLTADGLVGSKTIAAINSQKPYDMFVLAKQVRINHYNAIVKKDPSQAKWLNGWHNRVNSIEFEDK